MPDPDQAGTMRGPLAMESALAALHSLVKKDKDVSLEVGFAEGKIGLFARCTPRAAGLVESQCYAQYPDAEIEDVSIDLFSPTEGEMVVSADLQLEEPEVFPIKRHPQFIDQVSRQFVDTLAGISSSLVRYSVPGMRGHVQICIRPLSSHYRHKALKFLPVISKGLSKHWPSYRNFLADIHFARGWKQVWFKPLDMLLIGFRTWFLKPLSLTMSAGSEKGMSDVHDEIEDRGAMRTHDREDALSGAVDKIDRLLFLVNIRVSVIAPKGHEYEATAKLAEISSSFRQFSLPQSNGFHTLAPKVFSHMPLGITEDPFVLSAEEIATIWHLPNLLVKTPNLDWVISKKLEPPINLPAAGVTDAENNLTVLGEAVFHGHRTKFGIRPDDRRRHVYIIGKTGMGKSVLLQNMVYSDIMGGKGVAVIDPHGDLVDKILELIPSERSNDVVVFDPADREFPISFNILECRDPEQRPLICSGLMSVFTKLWPEAFSGRMEHILRNTLLALLESEGSTMLGILRMYGDDAYRAKVVSHVTDPLVKSFWEVEYAGWTDKYRTEAVAALQNKVGQLLSTPLIRNIVGQVTSTLDIRHAMDSGKIILVKLSKGRIGEDTSSFIGSMLVTKFQIDAMSRADIPEDERRDFYLYVDEFQNFVTPSFATILSEARKYRLALTMANQYIGQLLIANSTQLKDAIFGNVGSLVSFQIGSDDAEEMSLQFEEMVSAKDILSLPKYHAYTRLMIDGVPSKPFSVSTLPPPQSDHNSQKTETLLKMSRERYSEKRAVVEEKIAKWTSAGLEAQKTGKTVAKNKEKEEEEMKKAKEKKMTLEQYRAWRDREMWLNEYNSIRKKEMLGEEMTELDKQQYPELTKKLEATGGIPPPSKTILDALAKKNGTYVPKNKKEPKEGE